MSKIKIKAPSSVLIETVALQFAAIWWETGMSQGMKSKYKDARSFARNNVEKFVTRAVQHLTEMLGNPMLPPEQKEMIYDAILERANDPTNITSDDLLPGVDMKKVMDKINATQPELQTLKHVRPKPLSINTRLKSGTTLKG